MASLYITQYSKLGMDPNGQDVQAGLEPYVAYEKLTYTGTAAASAAFNAQTRFVRLHSDGIFSYRITAAGTAATTGDARVAANATEFIAVEPGSAMKVSAIVNT